MNTKTIRNAAAYNSMLQEIKAVIAAENITNYNVVEDRNTTLCDGILCYDHRYSGAYTAHDGTIFSTEYYSSVGTTSSESNFFEEEIPHISKDIVIRAIKLALQEAFSLPEFVGNDEQCPSDDDGMWWYNHRLVPSTIYVVVNDHEWSVDFQD